ncbi:MAG: LysR family transcriptional regulator [Eubacteriales bacterium]|nr:LysR family transcriptional regulator [Eubacteriales bacterium]
MELRVLEYYLTVAREENITKAAELLHITQPTLSRQLIQMEEELGVSLFKRGRHKIQLTEEGMLLRRRAQEMMDLANKTKQELLREEELSGTIVVGCGEINSMRWLTERMAEFRSRHPQVRFDLNSTTADMVKEQLERGLSDVGLLTEPVDVGRYQFIRLPSKVRWGVLVRRDSALAGKDSVKPEDLLEIPLLFVKRESVHNELANWFGEQYDHLNVAATYNLLQNAALMAGSLHGAALCMEHDVQYPEMAFVPLEPVLETGSVLVWKKNEFAPSLISSFTDYLKHAEKAFHEM